MANIDRYCVVGNPIEHSKSPEIHAQFAKQTGQQIRYDKQLVELGEFNHAAHTFFDEGGRGMNVTVPFKEDAFRFAEVLTERAELAGAVNTLALQENGQILGDNTDGQGLVWDVVERLQWPIRDRRICVLGAGGAVKGVLYMLLQQLPARLVLANRTVEKAQALAERFADCGDIVAADFSRLTEFTPFDVVINGTSASLSGGLPNISGSVFNQVNGVYDMVYSQEPTAFLRWADKHGAKQVSDGLGMLLGQAAESFSLWRGVTPNLNAVYQNFAAD